MVLEDLWNFRNRVLFEGKRYSLQTEVKALSGRFEEFLSVLNELKTTPRSSLTTPRCWSPPPNGVTKINSDASIGNGFASLGVVARNHARTIIKTRVTKENIEFPEAAAILRAMLLALEAGLSVVCCESDTKTIIQKLNIQEGGSIHWATVGFIKEILNLRPRFQSITFAWIPRKCNQLAHITSKWGTTSYFFLPISFLLRSKKFVDTLSQDYGSLSTT